MNIKQTIACICYLYFFPQTICTCPAHSFGLQSPMLHRYIQMYSGCMSYPGNFTCTLYLYTVLFITLSSNHFFLHGRPVLGKHFLVTRATRNCSSNAFCIYKCNMTSDWILSKIYDSISCDLLLEI